MGQSVRFSDKFEVAEVQVFYNRKYMIQARPQITSARDTYRILLEVWDKNTIEYVEQMKMILLDNKLQVLGTCDISTGGIGNTVCDPRVVFTVALQTAATRIIIAHNHPTGNLQPSRLDETLTEKINKAGELLDIRLIDHVIITRDGYLSFAEEGLLLL